MRYAACRALARAGGAGSLAAVAARLGDESKVVQRAAAEAVRSIGSRELAGVKPGGAFAQSFQAEIARALASGDDRVRRGATRVFAVHFRDIAQETAWPTPWSGGSPIADPVVQMQAVQGLWRWWYWRPEPPCGTRWKTALIARLAVPEHPWVRNLTEALYILGDENIRYLYNNWVPSLPRSEIRDRVTAAQHATVNRLAEKYTAALAAGSALQREGSSARCRSSSSGPCWVAGSATTWSRCSSTARTAGHVAEALAKQMADPDPTIRRLALQALVTIRGDSDPAVRRGVLARQGDADAEVREWAATMTKDFPLNVKPGPAEPALAARARRSARQPRPEARPAALGVLAQLDLVTPRAPRPSARFSATLRRWSARLRAGLGGGPGPAGPRRVVRGLWGRRCRTPTSPHGWRRSALP